MSDFNSKRVRATLVAVLITWLCAGCSKGEVRVTETIDSHCTMESSEKRAGFILQCIENANPKSDEEPEDWIRQCQYMAEQTLCPKITMIVTERCASNLGCIWREIKREPKDSLGAFGG